MYISGRNCIKLRKRATKIQVFLAEEPSEYVSFVVLGEPIKPVCGNHNILVISARFTKLTKTIPMMEASPSKVAKTFVTLLAVNYGETKEQIFDKGWWLTAKFFQGVRRILTVPNGFTTTFHAQTNGKF